MDALWKVQERLVEGQWEGSASSVEGSGRSRKGGGRSRKGCGSSVKGSDGIRTARGELIPAARRTRALWSSSNSTECTAAQIANGFVSE